MEELLARADPAVQAQIRALCDSQSKIAGPREGDAQIAALGDVVGERDEDFLVEQLAIFAATAPHHSEFQELYLYALLIRLDVPPSVVVRVLTPYWGSANEPLREFVGELFDGYTTAEFDDPFEGFTAYIRDKLSKNEEVPPELTVYLFERSPGRALLAYNRAAEIGNLHARLLEMRTKWEADREERRKRGEDPPLPYGTADQATAEAGDHSRTFSDLPPWKKPVGVPPRRRDEGLRDEIVLAEHVVSNAVWLKKHPTGDRYHEAARPDAREQLTKLAGHDEWWVRLYVAQIMRRHRELRVADVVEKLSRDSNAHVRALVESMAG